ncbi:MAG: tryptophan synthase subunit alpha [Dehalococcoidia bacterium]|nr:tryptophan synthase subunit alpha [Dehalococcoidia bacterium]
MSKRLRDLFAKSRAEGRPLFMPYVTAGYPSPAEAVDILLALEAGGADVIELGIPFTDPMADGATIQHANEVALSQGVTVRQCFQFVADARARGLQAPVLFMGYYNPILALGEQHVAELAAASGVDGFIIVDLPPEEADSFLAACRGHDLSFVPLVAPTTSDERIERLASVADAFLYCVSVTGTTGQRADLPEGLPAFLDRVRKHAELPLAVGFGISTREHVERVGRIADAAVVGSAIIAAIDAAAPGMAAQGVREYVEDVSGQQQAGVEGS